MKMLAIAFKDVLIVLRDRTTLLLLLAAPLTLALVTSFALLIVTPAAIGSTNGCFDSLAYYAPSMAALFLMFAMMPVARTPLAEHEAGTLDRLRAAPLLEGELLGGKVLGVFLIGLLQMAVLILVSHSVFQIFA